MFVSVSCVYTLRNFFYLKYLPSRLKTRIPKLPVFTCVKVFYDRKLSKFLFREVEFQIIRTAYDFGTVSFLGIRTQEHHFRSAIILKPVKIDHAFSNLLLNLCRSKELEFCHADLNS
jgi:hypothetical protein